MAKTKQTARKQSGSGMQKAKFPAKPSQSKDVPSGSSQPEDTEPREDTESRAETEDSETRPRETEPTASTSQQQDTLIVLPRHMTVGGMHPSFTKYYREHGMTSFLIKNLMTKRGWTVTMINKVIRNCNAAWNTSVAPIQNIRYNDEIDTDEELGPMPRTEDNVSVGTATVTSETLYIEGEPSAQTGLGTGVVTVSKRGGGQDALVPVARKEPRKPQKGRGRQGARRRGGNPTGPTKSQVCDKVRVLQRATKRKHRYRPRYPCSS